MSPNLPIPSVGAPAGPRRRAALAAATIFALFAAGNPVRAQRPPGPTDTAVLRAAPPLDSPTTVAPQPAAPVVIGTDTVLVIATPLGPFSAADRAAAVRERLLRLLRDPFIRPDSLNVVRHAEGSDLRLGSLVITTVTDGDAAVVGLSRDSLAALTRASLTRQLRQTSLATNLRALGLGVLYTLLATLLLWGALRLLYRGLRKLNRLVRLSRGARIRGLRIQQLELLSAERIVDALTTGIALVRVVLTASLLYLYLPLVLSFFPWTAHLAPQLVDYVTAPIAAAATAIASYIPNLLTIAVIIVITRYALKVVRLVFDGLKHGSLSLPGFYTDWADPTYKIARVLVIAFAVVVTWPYLPRSDSPAFKGVAAFLGLLLSLGSASAISNVVGGVVMVYMRPFRVGDRVRIADTEGDVVETSLLVTRVRTPKNVDVTIPNSMVLGSHIVNYSTTAGAGGVIVHTTVTIGYDAPWRDVHAALLAAARETPLVCEVPAPFVLQTSLDDFYVRYELNAYTLQPNQMAAIYSGLHQRIQDACNERGIEIMSPHYGALRDGSPLAVPGSYLPEGYEPPPFRVQRAGDSRGGEPGTVEPVMEGTGAPSV